MKNVRKLADWCLIGQINWLFIKNFYFLTVFDVLYVKTFC